MSYVMITPCSNMFFRDGKPFDKKDNYWLTSMNVPYPSTIYGALFSHLLRSNAGNSDFSKNVINKLNSLEQKELTELLKQILKIKQIYLYDKEDIYLPAPLDVFEDSKGRAKYGVFKNVSYQLTDDMKVDYVMNNPEDSNRSDNCFIKLKDYIYRYVNRNEMNIIHQDEIFINDGKLGIEINEYGTSKDKHLYRLENVQFINKKMGYLVNYEVNDQYSDLSFPEGYIKLGGEGKSAKIEIIDEIYQLKWLEKYYKSTVIKDKVKIIFTTSSLFNPNDKNTPFIPDLGFNKVIGLVNDRPIYIGGYNMASNKKEEHKSKTMLKGNKAGCVYIVKIPEKNKSLSEIYESLVEIVHDNYKESYKGFNNIIIAPFQEEYHE